MVASLKRYRTGANSRRQDVVCRELPESTDDGIKEVYDILVRQVAWTIASDVKGLSRQPCQCESRTKAVLTYGSARRVLAELYLCHTRLALHVILVALPHLVCPECLVW